MAIKPQIPSTCSPVHQEAWSLVWKLPILVFAIVMISQGGCSLGYNGQSLISSQDRQTLIEYKQFIAQQEVRRKHLAKQEQIRSQRANFTAPSQQAQAVDLEPSKATGPSRTDSQMFGTATGSRQRDTRFFFGQVSPNPPGLSTPMDGFNTVQQISFATEGADFDHDLDRSGKWMVFASTRHRSTSDLYVKSTHGSTVRQLTDDSGREQTPAFSPDGKWVAYASDQAGNWDIYLVPTAGGVSRQLTNSLNDEIHPSFSPDGNQLVFCSSGSRSGQWELVVISLDAPSVQKFIGHGLFPKWSPVEDRIVYQRPREMGSHYFGIWTLKLENGEGRGPTQVAASTNAAAITPSWSPDGRSVVFCTIVNPESDLQKGGPLQSNIWIIGTDGTGRTNLTHSRYADVQPIWASDGTIYFGSDRGRNGMENIWAIRTDAVTQMVQTKTQSALTAKASQEP